MDATTIVQNMLTQLKLGDKTASGAVGTPERKIIEAAAEVYASGYVDLGSVNQQHDIDSMVGNNLDSYLGGIFSFGRQSGTAAYGVVTFGRNTATDAVVIPSGTLVKATITSDDGLASTTVTFSTLRTVSMPSGVLSVDAPIQCTSIGEIGNVDSGAITSFAGLNPPSNISSVTNAQPITNGTSQEDDGAYRTRFRNTFLRNTAGTDSNYLALAVATTSATRATVIGPVSRFREYIQVPAENDDAQCTQVASSVLSPSSLTYSAGGYDSAAVGSETYKNKRTSVPSVLPYAKFVYQDQNFLTNGSFDPDTSVFFQPYVDYVFNTTPVAHSVNPWTINTRYEVGALVSMTATGTIAPIGSASSKVFMCTVAGTSGSGSEPTIATLNNTTTDGTVTWKWVSTVKKQTLDMASKAKPNVTILGQGSTGSPIFPVGLEPGSIALLEFAYLSKASRNNYDAGIMNCVDVYVNGGAFDPVSSVHVVPNSSGVIQNTDAGKWTYNLYGQSTASANVINWRRKADGRVAAVGNWLQPLAWQPAIDAPDSITIDSQTFYRANYYNPSNSTYYNRRTGSAGSYVYSLKAHYAFVEEVNGLAGTVRARNGIEWFMAAGNPNNHLAGRLGSDPDTSYTGKTIDDAFFTGKQFSAENYSYNSDIPKLQASYDANKQSATDVLAHAAKTRYFKCHLTVVYNPGASPTSVNSVIDSALSVYFASQPFGTTIQLSDILQTVHNVPGVDNVRWTVDRQWTTVPVWKKNAALSVGTVIQPTSGHANNYYYVVSSAGTTGGSEPTWLTTGTVTDGTVSFTPIFAARVEEVNADGTARDQFYNRFYNDDFYLMDDELPASPSSGASDITIRAQNTFTQI